VTNQPTAVVYQAAQPVANVAATNAEPPLSQAAQTVIYQPTPAGTPDQLQTEVGQVPTVPAPKLVVAEKYQSRVGHESDYSWITGHLFFVHANGGRWVVRYSLPSEIDKFGGSVVLAPGVEMKNYREGDLVCVTGDVLSEQRFSPSLSGALYRVNTITLLERADP
jgi:hypothetical protein